MGRQDYETETLIAFGWQNSASQGDSVDEHVTPTLDKSKTPAVAFDLRGREGGAQFEGPHDTANIRASSGGSSRSYVVELASRLREEGLTLKEAQDLGRPYAVRRLTPVECERLQGFPDNWTSVTYRNKPAADGPRYKALGNSMAVPVMEWILNRLRLVDAAARKEAA